MRAVVRVFLTFPTNSIGGSSTYEKNFHWESCSHMYKEVFPKI